MHHIEIQHFGPIQKISMDVNNFMIFIGPQASGKSTISKSIYFFKSIKNDFSEYFRNLTESEEESNLSELTKKIRRKFLNIWGPSFELENNVFIKYLYQKDVYIEISKNIENGYINIKFSTELMKKFNSITQKAIDFIKYNPKVKISGLNSYKEQKKYEDNKQIFLDNMEIYYSEIFDENKELFFIPASRSLLATLSEYLQNVKIDKLDFLMSDFLDRITYYKEIFSKNLITIIEEKINLEEKM